MRRNRNILTKTPLISKSKQHLAVLKDRAREIISILVKDKAKSMPLQKSPVLLSSKRLTLILDALHAHSPGLTQVFPFLT